MIKFEKPIFDEPKKKVFEKSEKDLNAEKVKIPFYCSDSLEADFIRAKIKFNKEYLKNCKTKSLYQKIEKDTLFLENNVFPIIQAQTNLFFSEVSKMIMKNVDKAVQTGCNSMVLYLPINENYDDTPKVGVANLKDDRDLTPLSVEIRADFFLYRKDGNHSPFEYIDLNKDTDNQ